MPRVFIKETAKQYLVRIAVPKSQAADRGELLEFLERRIRRAMVAWEHVGTPDRETKLRTKIEGDINQYKADLPEDE